MRFGVSGLECIFFRSRIVLLALLVAVHCPGAERIFRAGAAIVDITPTNLPIRTAGNLRLTIADKVLDPLKVRAIVLDNQRIQIVIAVVDSCMMDRETMDAAKSIAQK